MDEKKEDNRKYHIKEGTRGYADMAPPNLTKDEYMQLNGDLCTLVYSDDDAEGLFDLHGYKEDVTFRKKNMRVFVNPKTKHGIVVYRGTVVTDARDLGADVSIASSAQKISPQFRNALTYFNGAAKKYGSEFQFSTTGHSLGGAKAMYIAEKYDNVRALAYNPGISPRSHGQSVVNKIKGVRNKDLKDLLTNGGNPALIENRVVIIRNEKDPVSALGSFKNYNTVELPQKRFGWLNKKYKIGNAAKSLLGYHGVQQFASYTPKKTGQSEIEMQEMSVETKGGIPELNLDSADEEEEELIDEDEPIEEKYFGDEPSSEVKQSEIEMQEMSAETKGGVKRKAAGDANLASKRARAGELTYKNNKDVIGDWYAERSNLRQADAHKKWGMEKVATDDEFKHLGRHMNDPEVMDNPNIQKYETHTGRVYSEMDEKWVKDPGYVDPATTTEAEEILAGEKYKRA